MEYDKAMGLIPESHNPHFKRAVEPTAAQA